LNTSTKATMALWGKSKMDAPHQVAALDAQMCLVFVGMDEHIQLSVIFSGSMGSASLKGRHATPSVKHPS